MISLFFKKNLWPQYDKGILATKTTCNGSQASMVRAYYTIQGEKKIQIHITNESVLIQIPKEIGTNCNNMTLP